MLEERHRAAETGELEDMTDASINVRRPIAHCRLTPTKYSWSASFTRLASYLKARKSV